MAEATLEQTYAEPDLELASQGRRLAAFVLDAVLTVVTLGIGWIIWYLVAARHGQSPAKQLLGIRVIRDDGSTAGLLWMLLRDLVIRGIVFWGLNYLATRFIDDIGGLVVLGLFAVAALWCVWDANRQCLWDRVARTYVVLGRENEVVLVSASPAQEAAENLRTLEELRERGLLTDEEFEERRAREMERL